MTLVLDTSVIIDLERRDKVTIQKLKELSVLYPAPAEITFVTEFEFLLGVQKRNVENKEKAAVFLHHFSVLHTTSRTSSILASLKEKYDAQGLALPLADLLLASLVMEHDKILVTKDEDFRGIQELKKVMV